jgi:hypothetical protein
MKIEGAGMAQATELQWRAAPVRAEWGDGMMVADVELSKDETLTLYAHRDALHLVVAALSAIRAAAAMAPKEGE